MKRKLTIISGLALFLIPLLVFADGTTELPNPIACGSLNCIFISTIRILLGAVGIFALFMFMWGGFLMLTSAGNQETIKKARDTLVWASLGMVVIIASWAFISYFLKIFTGAVK
jgi:uncharacterized BrkB/YihY/UPF0761 family membrane protein